MGLLVQISNEDLNTRCIITKVLADFDGEFFGFKTRKKTKEEHNLIGSPVTNFIVFLIFFNGFPMLFVMFLVY